jgi:hypothetical protein
MHAAPGRFALLLGSGISASAGIPSGWEVVSDLARRIAAVEGEADDLDDPIAWYASRYGGAPDYSSLLEAVAPTAGQRRDLLSGYFEPTETERASGLKSPTAAHRAIARLVARGTVSVVVTTNFDRLLEQALQSVGVEPVVVSTSAGASGSTPLAHSRCTIIKVHGDYLDPNIKNTVGELGSYEPPLDALLDRVFDDYGLVICGWSGTWDSALRHAIERCPTRRYGTYWAARGEPSPDAAMLIAHRDAADIAITDADAFFDSLAEKIEALDELQRRSVTGVDVVVAEAKRYLPDPIHRIRLHDLVMDSGTRSIASIDFDGNDPTPSADLYIARTADIEAASIDMMAMNAVLGQFADRQEHEQLLQRLLLRLAGPTRASVGGYTAWVNLRGYSALLGMYSAGLASVASDNWSFLAAAVSTTVADPQRNERERVSYAQAFNSWTVLDSAAANSTFETGRKTPVSDFLHLHLDAALRPHLQLSAEEFEQVFDEWEYLIGVLVTDSLGRGPLGRWVWRTRHRGGHPLRALKASQSALLDSGCFGGSDDRLDEATSKLNDFADRSGLAF